MQLSARKGVITVRAGKIRTYREIPVHAGLHEHLKLWINDERPVWPGADSPALPLNQRGGHVLRHTFGTCLVREGHDIVLVAELGGERLDGWMRAVETDDLPAHLPPPVRPATRISVDPD